MTRKSWALVLLLAAALVPGGSQAQSLNARRLGMGGVVTSDNGDRTGVNIAFRAVPQSREGTAAIPLPLGLIQFAGDHPTFDSGDSTFNIYEIMNVVLNPPLTIQIKKPEAVSGDISVYVAQDSLQIDLSDVRRVIPDGSMRNGGVYHLSGLGKRFGIAFVHVSPLVHVRNSFTPSDELRAALRDAVPFQDLTRYGLTDEGRAQAAVAFQAGAAWRALHSPSTLETEIPDPRRNGCTAIYLGAGPKYLWGLAYADAYSLAGVTTGDTLFSDQDPVSFDMDTQTRHALIGGDGGSGSGFGSDVGAVVYWRNFELGLGLNDLGSRIRWKTTVRQHVYDDSTNQFMTSTVEENARYTSRIPVTTTVNVAKRIGRTTLAADVVEGEFNTTLHAGAEFWFGKLALRGGTYRDQNQLWQAAGGAGVRFGRIGLDAAVATNSRNIQRERGAELSASLSLY